MSWTLEPDLGEWSAQFGRFGSEPDVVLYMPTRRSTLESRVRWDLLYQVAMSTRVAGIFIADKTLDGSATQYFTSLPLREGLAAAIIRRPFAVDPFKSWSGLKFSPSTFLATVHDDDWWEGDPSILPEGISGMTHCPVPIANDYLANSRCAECHESRYFGLIRGDIWTSFTDFCSQFNQVSPSADLTLSWWLKSLGRGGTLRHYSYVYDNSNWNSYASADLINTRWAREMGWADLASSAAIRLSHFLDDLSSLSFLSKHTSSAEIGQLTQKRLEAFPPFDTLSPMSSIARKLPSALRGRIVMTRGQGRGLTRMRAVAGLQGDPLEGRPKSSASQVVFAGVYVNSVKDVIDKVLQPLWGFSPTGTQLAQRVEIWRSNLECLSEILKP